MNNTKYKDIAEVAGVSKSSVTRFFDKKFKVRPEIGKKITKALKDLGTSLPVERVIGLIIPDADNPYFTSIAFEFEKEFERHGWHLLIANSDGKLSKDLQIIDRYKGLGISGLIYINSGNQNDELYSSLIANHHNLPVLSFDRQLESRNFDYVAIDSKKGTLQSVDYLFTKGHQKIAYLKGLKGTFTAKQRHEAFEEAMAANRIKIEPKFIFEGDYKIGTGIECADRLIEMKPEERPTAIICANDLMAIGLMQRLQKAGWKLPDQLSVIGFDDIPMSKWVYPALTTIAQPVRILVAKASAMLLKRIEAGRSKIEIPQQKETVTPMLVPRESVAEPYNGKKTKLMTIHKNNNVLKTLNGNHHE
ncbi:MAG: Catabolite control protein A [Bacteroidia bacterium]|nr:Catabolite control protein A [Bacteroidia bacterium]